MRSKSLVRQSSLQQRAEISRDERADYSKRIFARCRHEFSWPDYERVLIYLPIERQNEVDTWPLIRWIWATWPAIEVFAPRVQGEHLEAVRVTPLTQYAWGPYEVPEAVSGDVLGANESLDVIFAPLLAFDDQGNRIGYGKGYFDRFLAAHPRAERIGLAYECQRADEGIAAEAHDVALQAVITEEKIQMF